MNLTSAKVQSTLMIAFVVTLLLVGGRLLMTFMPDGSHDPALLVTPPFSVTREATISEAATELLSSLGKEVILDKRLERNLFTEWQTPARVDISLKLDSIIIEGPPVFYQGLMKDDDGTYIAQINLEGRRSYFLSEGESAQGWTVVKIAPEAVQVRNASGKEIRYPYRGGEDLKKRKFYAVIMMEPDKKTFNVKEGDDLSEFKVTKVTENSVVLEKDGLPLTLQKGSPGIVIDRSEDLTLKESNEKSAAEPDKA